MPQELLFEELSPLTANLISESGEQGKKLFLNGIFMQAEVQNRNQRIYPLSEVTDAVGNLKRSIESTNGVMGELDHPSTITLNLDRVSHVIKDIRMEGNNAIGRAEILNTPMGNIAKELINAGVNLGVSSRGTGTVNEGKVSGFNVVTIDIVANPSAQGAVPNAIYESLDSSHGKKVMSLAESVRHDPTAQKYFLEEFKKWLSGEFN